MLEPEKNLKAQVEQPAATGIFDAASEITDLAKAVILYIDDKPKRKLLIEAMRAITIRSIKICTLTPMLGANNHANHTSHQE